MDYQATLDKMRHHDGSRPQVSTNSLFTRKKRKSNVSDVCLRVATLTMESILLIIRRSQTLHTTERKINMLKVQLEVDRKLHRMANTTEATITVRTRKVLQAIVGLIHLLVGWRLTPTVELNRPKTEITMAILMQRTDRNTETKHP